MKKSTIWMVIGIIAVLIILILILNKAGLFSSVIPSGALVGTELSAEKLSENGNEEDSRKIQNNPANSKTMTNQEKEYNNLIKKILELRQAQDLLKKSELIIEIDFMVVSLNNNPITGQWETISLCLAETCTDNDFFDMIITVTLEGDEIGLSYSNLIVNFLTANKYWNTGNILKFSKAITVTNNLVIELNDEIITSKWHEIIECGGSCTNKNELNFEMIKSIVR